MDPTQATAQGIDPNAIKAILARLFGGSVQAGPPTFPQTGGAAKPGPGMTQQAAATPGTPAQTNPAPQAAPSPAGMTQPKPVTAAPNPAGMTRPASAGTVSRPGPTAGGAPQPTGTKTEAVGTTEEGFPSESAWTAAHPTPQPPRYVEPDLKHRMLMGLFAGMQNVGRPGSGSQMLNEYMNRIYQGQEANRTAPANEAAAAHQAYMSAAEGAKAPLSIDEAKAELENRRAQTQANLALADQRRNGPKGATPTLSTEEGKAVEDRMGETNPATNKPYTRLEAIKDVTGAKTPQRAQKFDPVAASLGGEPDGANWNGKSYATPQEASKAYGDAYLAKMQAEKPSKNGFMNMYALYRFMDMAYHYNPDLLKMMPAMAKQLGVPVPPGLDLSQVPAAQPTDAEGKPIGLSQPGAPTAPTRSAGQFAEKALAAIPRIRDEVSGLDKNLGPISGREAQFLVGKVGSSGDDKFDEKYATLADDLHFLTSNAARFHLNSVRAVQEFNKLADAGKMSSAAINGFIDSMQNWAKDAAAEGRGRPPGGQQQNTLPKGLPDLKTGNGGKPIPDGAEWHVGGKVVAVVKEGKWAAH